MTSNNSKPPMTTGHIVAEYCEAALKNGAASRVGCD
jgi:hypothetical protein